MLTLSATCLAIAVADEAGTLRLSVREGRFGQFVAIEDDRGLIEIAADMAEATARVRAVRQRIA